MPLRLLQDISPRDGVISEGTTSTDTDPLGQGSGRREEKSPGSPTLNPFMAPRRPGLALPGIGVPGCAPCQRERAGSPDAACRSTRSHVAHLLLPFQATSSSCGSNGMLLPSFSTGLTYEARYGTDSQTCQRKGARTQRAVARSPHTQLPTSHCSGEPLPSVAHLLRADAGPARAQAGGLSRGCSGARQPRQRARARPARQGRGAVPARPGVQGERPPAGERG